MTDVPKSPQPVAGVARAPLWLGIGAALGLVLAAVGLIREPMDHDLPDDAAVRVNGTELAQARYDQLVEALAADRREPLGERERAHVLDRMIDEELLVQRGLAMGLARHDRRVRSDLVAAMIEHATSTAEPGEPDTATLREFYGENASYFASAPRLRVSAVHVLPRDGEDESARRERARVVAERLRAGDDVALVREQVGDPELAPVPHDLLTASKLGLYLGAAAVESLAGLAIGEVPQPVQLRSGGWRVLRVDERDAGRTPPFEAIEARVRQEFERRAEERALRRYIEELRSQADIVVQPRLLPAAP
jgi:hypothetical protein